MKRGDCKLSQAGVRMRECMEHTFEDGITCPRTQLLICLMYRCAALLEVDVADNEESLVGFRYFVSARN